jgi:hypothetical protein
MRAIKRIRYGEKELLRLKNMCNKSDNNLKNQININKDLMETNELVGTKFVRISLDQNKGLFLLINYQFFFVEKIEFVLCLISIINKFFIILF